MARAAKSQSNEGQPKGGETGKPAAAEPEQRLFVALSAVELDGIAYPLGSAIPLTEAQADALRLAAAIEGSWEAAEAIPDGDDPPSP